MKKPIIVYFELAKNDDGDQCEKKLYMYNPKDNIIKIAMKEKKAHLKILSFLWKTL